ncbi:phosphate-starvation-inducible PsiE family protein [Halosegnis sp.]|uniref:phosphate-starvation-inducible PsiE family protein n=1 Tax=Halosegnis sp. TaxID=2864959 RepID=UPI0035D446E0
MSVDEMTVTRTLERAMRFLELGAAGLLVLLFAVGVADFGLKIIGLAASGRITSPRAVVGLIDTALLLFIIVEVFLTVVAYSRDEPVVRIVLVAALIAIARKVITFRTTSYASVEAALTAAAAYGGLLAVLAVGFYLISRLPPGERCELV